MKKVIQIIRKGNSILFKFEGKIVAETPVPSGNILQEMVDGDSTLKITNQNGFTKFKLTAEESKEVAAMILLDEMTNE